MSFFLKKNTLFNLFESSIFVPYNSIFTLSYNQTYSSNQLLQCRYFEKHFHTSISEQIYHVGVGTPVLLPSQISVSSFEVDENGYGFTAYNINLDAANMKLSDFPGYFMF